MESASPGQAVLAADNASNSGGTELDSSFRRSARRSSEARLDLLALLDAEETADDASKSSHELDPDNISSSDNALDSSFHQSARRSSRDGIDLLALLDADDLSESGNEDLEDQVEEAAQGGGAVPNTNEPTNSGNALGSSFLQSARGSPENNLGVFALLDADEDLSHRSNDGQPDSGQANIPNINDPSIPGNVLDSSFRQSARRSSENRLDLLGLLDVDETATTPDDALSSRSSKEDSRNEMEAKEKENESESKGMDPKTMGQPSGAIPELKKEGKIRAVQVEDLPSATTQVPVIATGVETNQELEAHAEPGAYAEMLRQSVSQRDNSPIRATAPSSSSRPGAFSGPTTPRESSDRSLLSRQPSVEGLSQTSIDTSGQSHVELEDTDNRHGLPVAQSVDGTNLQAATEVDLGQDRAPSTTVITRKERRIGFALLLLLLLGAVCAIVLLAKGVFTSTHPTDSDLQFSPEDMAIMSESSYFWESLPQGTRNTIEKDTEEASPQSRAFQWLMEDPNFDRYTRNRMIQRFALATFYFATLGHKNGWRQNDGWLSHELHECNWTFVAPSGWLYEEAHPEPDIIAKLTKVQSPCELGDRDSTEIGEEYQKLWFYANDLQGSLPSELFLLTSLKSILLSNNPGLTGSLSTELGNLNSLNYLEISYTHVNGRIPSQIGTLTDLVDIYLMGSSGGQLTGTLPTEVGHLTSARRFDANQQQISGTVPSQVGNMHSLAVLEMSKNRLTGSIPSDLVRLTGLVRLALSENRFSGQGIPRNLDRMTALQEVFLSYNKPGLTGTIPSELKNLPLRRFWIHGNRLSGTIPTEVGLLVELQELSVHENMLTGSLPSAIGNLKELGFFWASDNHLEGQLPSELGLLTHLYDLELLGNMFNGTIPLELASLATNAALAGLDVTGNALTGEVPQELCSLDGSNKTFPESFWWRNDPVINFDCGERLCGCDCDCTGETHGFT